MPEFIRPKGSIVHEISVHDSKIINVSLKKDVLTLGLDRCSALVRKNGTKTMTEVSPAYLKLHDFDKSEPMTSFLMFGKRKYRTLEFNSFMKMLKNGDIANVEITDVFYRDIDILIIGALWKKKKWKGFQLRLCFTGDMVFGYEKLEDKI